MPTIIKLATININAITNHTRIGMLTEYIRRHDLDIIFLQEITDPELLQTSGYDVYYNIGSDTRGTATVARNDIILHNINKSPSGRAIAAKYKGLHIVNIYTPSGTAKQTEREHFYNAEVPQLLQTGHGEIIIGGNFNCVLDPADTSGHFHTSRALTEMTRGLQLKDTWKQDQNRPVYTHYSNTGASHIDRIYISRNIVARVTGTDFIPAAFTDHSAVVVHLVIGDMGMRKRPQKWKLDPNLLRDEELRNQLRQQWSRWQTQRSW
jgi:exonuclease III